jgi:hypothetical protein
MDRRRRTERPGQTRLQERGRLVRPAQPPWFERARAELEGEDAEGFFRRDAPAGPTRPAEGSDEGPPVGRALPAARPAGRRRERLLGSPAAVRRAILLAEILAPPKALRRGDDA